MKNSPLPDPPGLPPPRTREDLADAGRRASARELADRLAHADLAFLEGALQNPALGVDLVVVLLRNRGATESLLRRLRDDTRFRSSYPVCAGLASHPSTPRAIAMDLTHHLHWRDLARLADSFRAPPTVRRLALRLLTERLGELALGEQTCLARTAGRTVVRALRHTHLAAVAGALLSNRSLLEEDVVWIVRAPHTEPETLARIAADAKWCRSHPVQLALVHNDRTPVGAALGLLTGLPRGDLEALASRADRAPLLRAAAERVLESWAPHREPASVQTPTEK